MEDKLNSLSLKKMFFSTFFFPPFEPQGSLPTLITFFFTLNKVFQLSYGLFPETLSCDFRPNFNLEASVFILSSFPNIYNVSSSSVIGKIMFPLFF